MPPIHILMKPSSGNCNLRCQYCFYYDTMSKREVPSYGYMQIETLEAVIKQALAYATKECTFAYQGGEPTLSGIDFFKKAIEFQNKYNVHKVNITNTIQTNGTTLTGEWAAFFKEHQFLVGVSLDGSKRSHDCYRLDANGQESFLEIMDKIQLLNEFHVDYNILSVVHKKSAEDIERNYKFFQKNGFDFLQFIPCLDPLDETPGQREYSLTPKAYGEFLIRLFRLWKEDLLAGKQPYIRQFENYIGMLMQIPPEACDMRGVCGNQYVVEADGGVYPCDFYVLEENKLGNFLTDTVEMIDEKRKEIGFVEESLNREPECEKCRYFMLCRGGCRRNRLKNENYHQYFCQSYQMFFDACLEDMVDIAEKISAK